MKGLLVRVNFFFRRLACRIFGHVSANASMGTVGLRIGRRCLRIVEQKTVRARVTHGEIEKGMAAHPPEGYSFVDCNRKKRTAKFVNPYGALAFVAF
jgi:hypothetical protein